MERRDRVGVHREAEAVRGGEEARLQLRIAGDERPAPLGERVGVDDDGPLPLAPEDEVVRSRSLPLHHPEVGLRPADAVAGGRQGQPEAGGHVPAHGDVVEAKLLRRRIPQDVPVAGDPAPLPRAVGDEDQSGRARGIHADPGALDLLEEEVVEEQEPVASQREGGIARARGRPDRVGQVVEVDLAVLPIVVLHVEEAEPVHRRALFPRARRERQRRGPGSQRDRHRPPAAFGLRVVDDRELERRSVVEEEDRLFGAQVLARGRGAVHRHEEAPAGAPAVEDRSHEIPRRPALGGGVEESEVHAAVGREAPDRDLPASLQSVVQGQPAGGSAVPGLQVPLARVDSPEPAADLARAAPGEARWTVAEVVRAVEDLVLEDVVVPSPFPPGIGGEVVPFAVHLEVVEVGDQRAAGNPLVGEAEAVERRPGLPVPLAKGQAPRPPVERQDDLPPAAAPRRVVGALEGVAGGPGRDATIRP